MNSREVNFWHWFVDKIPKRIMYFCFIHVMAYSTTGKYGSSVVSELSGMDAIGRYQDDLIL